MATRASMRRVAVRPRPWGFVAAAVAHAGVLTALGVVVVSTSAPEAQAPRLPGVVTLPVSVAEAPVAEPETVAQRDDEPSEAPVIDVIPVELPAEELALLEPAPVTPALAALGGIAEHPTELAQIAPRRRPAAPVDPALAAAAEPPVTAMAAPIAATTAAPALAPLERIDPVYPTRAQRAGIEGVVLVRLTIDAAGAVADVAVAASSGSSVLDEAALSALRRWRFAPWDGGTRNLEQRVAFRLN